MSLMITIFHWVVFSLFIAIFCCLIFILLIHFFVPKIMIKTYFKEPYFSPLEIKLFTGPPYAYKRTVMMMRLAGWPDCGKKRGIPATAHEVCPVWFQVLSRVFIRIFLTIVALFLFVGVVLAIAFTAFGVW